MKETNDFIYSDLGMNDISLGLEKIDVALILLVGLAASLTLAVSLYYTEPVGWDIHFHYSVARIWAAGGNGMFSDIVMQTNKMPYPPVFHWLLVPAVWFGVEWEFARALQVLFYPLALATSMFVVYKARESKQQALLTGLFLVSSFGFYDHAIQVFPQSLDAVLFPIAIWLYLKKDKPWWLVAAGLMVWSHGLAALALLGGLAMLSLKEHYKQFLAFAGISAPVVVSSLIFLAPALARWSGVDSQSEASFNSNPVTWTLWYLGVPLSLILIFVVYRVWKNKTADKLDWISIATLLTLIPLGIWWHDRYFAYAAMPLSYIAAKATANTKQLKPYIILVLLILVAIYYVDYWLAIFSNAYELKPI